MVGFTPVNSAIGGLVIGAAAVGRLTLTGKILGVSGIVRGIFRKSEFPWRASFLAGLMSGGYFAARLLPGVFEPLLISPVRSAIGGLLVGLGASMGNGCTSGHGISGNARLSPRSMIYTLTFMASGFVSASLFATASAFGLPSTRPALAHPSSEFLKTAAIALPTALFAMTLTALTSKASRMQPAEGHDPNATPPVDVAARNLAEFVTGSTFGFGLGMAGMTLPSKVAAFLSIAHPAFDPSLIFVMAGALLVALPGTSVIKRNPGKRPYCGGKLELPSRKDVDAKLVLGGVLFGAGWGIAGLCPGPALANVANLSKPLVSYLVGLGSGLLLDRKLASPLVDRLAA